MFCLPDFDSWERYFESNRSRIGENEHSPGEFGWDNEWGKWTCQQCEQYQQQQNSNIVNIDNNSSVKIHTKSVRKSNCDGSPSARRP